MYILLRYGTGTGGKTLKQAMKRLPRAKLPLPDFQSSDEAARYFESHSVAEVWDRLPEVKGVKLSKELEKRVHERRMAEGIQREAKRS